ncbi:histone deacetylase [Shewanella sp. NFH-SH190041]|uniref:histone deacetylase family protein n=1 Tax=Shewanella sp. NFH-SH190041 TaxID=2950245 RepID=UPI0021C3FF91|nr:histone deacetylase [Shewanella sp. NFH-SH190041]BDM65025.1 histone deacetylase [Shewanella sp. NFH-SH190041]
MLPLVYHASYSQLALPPKHRFPIGKYRSLYHTLCRTGYASATDFLQPTPVSEQALCTIHHPDYVANFFRNQLPLATQRRIGLPWSQELVQRTRYALGGTALTAQLAWQQGIALHLTGGYHHAHADFGSGFCIFNDLIFAARQLLDTTDTERVLIIDCDVHQGDGSATLAQLHPDIITCSLHCEKNFPARKSDSDCDIALPKGCNDTDYLEALSQVVGYLIRLHQPDVILYDAGVDVHQDDELGYLNLTTAGIYARDHWVLHTAKCANIPIAAVIGGGYSRDLQALTQRHLQLFLAANDVFGR